MNLNDGLSCKPTKPFTLRFSFPRSFQLRHSIYCILKLSPNDKTTCPAYICTYVPGTSQSAEYTQTKNSRFNSATGCPNNLCRTADENPFTIFGNRAYLMRPSLACLVDVFAYTQHTQTLTHTKLKRKNMPKKVRVCCAAYITATQYA